jgi:hypothetical protein
VNLWEFFNEMVRASRERNLRLAEIETMIRDQALATRGIESELARMVDTLEQLADVMVPKDGGVVAGILLGPEIPDPADSGGSMEILTAVHDNNLRLLELALPLTSEGGNPINGTDGAPWNAPGWGVVSEDVSILEVLPDDGAVVAIQGRGDGVLLRGKGVGQCTGTLNIPMPDGSTIHRGIAHTTLISGPGTAAVTLGDEIADPNPTG